MEEWKRIPELPEYYASSLGRIKRGDVIKSLRDDGHGYLQISIKKYPNRRTYRVHQLVARTFIPNPNGYDTVHHKNNIPTDNRPENLEWTTRSINVIYDMDNKDRDNKGRFLPKPIPRGNQKN